MRMPGAAWWLTIVLALGAVSCVSPMHPRGRAKTMLVTAYCSCQECCSWERNWYFRPVVASGPDKGKPKAVGVCADGTRASKGTIAADTRYYPFGTRIYVPGYGQGVVRDRGRAIDGPAHIDIYFKSHSQSMQWGRRTMTVYVE